MPQGPRRVGADHVQVDDLVGIVAVGAVGAVALGAVPSKTAWPRSALAASIGNGYFGGFEALEVRLDVAEGRLEVLELVERLLAEQELHVRADRAGVGAAVVVHRRFLRRGATRRGRRARGGWRPAAAGSVRIERSGLRRLSRTTEIIPALTVPRDVLRVKRLGGSRRPSARVRSSRRSLQVERGVAEPDVARPADRAAVADHAVDLDPVLRAVGAVAAAEAHRQAVVGDTGRGAGRSGGGRPRRRPRAPGPGRGRGSSQSCPALA